MSITALALLHPRPSASPSAASWAEPNSFFLEHVVRRSSSGRNVLLPVTNSLVLTAGVGIYATLAPEYGLPATVNVGLPAVGVWLWPMPPAADAPPSPLRD